eukprot:TRINITY_DN3010_c0_g1_i1.p1 TRINITY_DN3010_c0_g1~~TRINITY_DN3010_c0_g1_i1.p1  ORF type:complete len:364 (+),score=52.36 TRINITY_DN3010_c0_g1_i1:38-1093(+)
MGQTCCPSRSRSRDVDPSTSSGFEREALYGTRVQTDFERVETGDDATFTRDVSSGAFLKIDVRLLTFLNNDILLFLMAFLNTSDRLNCRLVCRAWADQDRQAVAYWIQYAKKHWGKRPNLMKDIASGTPQVLWITTKKAAGCGMLVGGGACGVTSCCCGLMLIGVYGCQYNPWVLLCCGGARTSGKSDVYVPIIHTSSSSSGSSKGGEVVLILLAIYFSPALLPGICAAWLIKEGWERFRTPYDVFLPSEEWDKMNKASPDDLRAAAERELDEYEEVNKDDLKEARAEDEDFSPEAIERHRLRAMDQFLREYRQRGGRPNPSRARGSKKKKRKDSPTASRSDSGEELHAED